MVYQIPGVAHVWVNPNRLTSAVTPIIPVQQPLFSLYLQPFQPGTVTPILGPPIPQTFPVPHQDQPTYITYPTQVPTTLPLQGPVVQKAEPIARVSQPFLSPAFPAQPPAVLPVQGPIIQQTLTKFQDQPVLIPQPFQPGTMSPIQGATIQQTFPIARQDQPTYISYPQQPEVTKRTESLQQWYVFPVNQPSVLNLTVLQPVIVPRLEPPPPQQWYVFPVKQPYFVQLPQIPNVNPRPETIIEPVFTFSSNGPMIFQLTVTSGTISIFKPGS